MSDIILDQRIRDWVFLPIIFVMFMIQLLKYFLAQYQENKKVPAKVTSKSQMSEVIDKNLAARSQSLTQLHSLLPEQSFKMKRAFLCDKDGLLSKASERPAKDPLQSMQMMNPSAMAEMLMNNLSGIVSMAVQYQWVSYFFSGFVIGKMPFPLTQKFRMMLQRGVDIQNLDVRYISSISIYFLMLFGGLQKIQTLMMGDNQDDFQMPDNVQQQMNMQMMGMGQPSADPGKQFTAQKTRLEGIKHTFSLTKYQDKALVKLQKFIQ